MYKRNTIMKVSVLAALMTFVILTAAFSRYGTPLFSFMESQSRVLDSVFFGYGQKISIENLSAMVIAPTKSFPAKDYETLKKTNETLIGSIYTDNPIEKFELREPGMYGIVIRKTDNEFSAVFLDANHREVGKAKATVRRAERYFKEPEARFKFNSPGIEICWDNVCIEI